ncbi:leukocidin family pore-forming toxin, partial [Enterococcus faecalis]|nr:leukocidin family pore-forming toxin [Enterococcus faecalis]
LFTMISVSLCCGFGQDVQVFADNPVLGTEVTFEKDENGRIVKIISKNQYRITIYNSVDAGDTPNDASVSLDVDFIDDKNSGEMGAVASINTFIPSGLRYVEGYKYKGVTNPIYKNLSAGMLWPKKYRVEVVNIPIDQATKIITATPNNNIKEKQVSDTISYGFGGSVSADGKKPGGSIEANLAYTKTTTYDQPDYETSQIKKTTKEAVWDTSFVETRDGYTPNSWNPVYGNQMFMRGRYSNVSPIDNIKKGGEVSSLISGGFSPKMGVVLASPNGTKKSQFVVRVSRMSDMYIMRWSGTEWGGENEINQNVPKEYNALMYEDVKFEIDWEQRTVRTI